MSKLIFLFFFVYISLPLTGADHLENGLKDPAIVQMCKKKDFYIKCAVGMGVFIAPNQVLTAYHVISPVFQTNDTVKNAVFFRHPKRSAMKISFDRIVAASAIDDLAILEVTDYTSEDFYPLEETGEDSTFLIGEEVSLKRFPRYASLPFDSLPVVFTGFESNEDYYILAEFPYRDAPYKYDIRGMSGGPVLMDNRLIGIVSRGSSSHAYIALVNREKVNRFEHCRSDDFCIENTMQALHEEGTNGNNIAQYLLFMKYRSGVEVEQDIAQADYWRNQALSLGYSVEGVGVIINTSR